MKPVIALGSITILWGYGWVIMKIGLENCGPFTFNALRMCLSTFFLFIILRFLKKELFPKRCPELILLGLFQTTLLFTLSTFAVYAGNTGKVAFLVYSMPFFTLILSRIFLRETLNKIQIFTIFLALSGFIFMTFSYTDSSLGTSSILAILAGFTWAISAIITKKIQRRQPIDLLSLTTWQMFFGCIPLVIITFIIDDGPIIITPIFLVNITFISVFVTALGWVLWTYSLENMKAGTVGIFSLLTPVIAVLASSVHLQENLSPIELSGATLIGIALLVMGAHNLHISSKK